MQETCMISDYAALLAGKLSFDPLLSRRVREEVEDHLCEAVAASAACDMREAERLAIARFGDPHAIAAQLALAALAKHSRKMGVALVMLVAGVYTVMKARIAWYTATQWTLHGDFKGAGNVVGLLDARAFWLSVILGVLAFGYIHSRRVTVDFRPACRRQLGRFLLLCAAAATALIVSVIGDGLLTVFRLLRAEMSTAFLIPIGSMAIEFACVGILIFHIRAVARRTSRTAILLST
jgi:hypothetical protein